jgi:translation initiation factor IF-2
VPIIVAINKVDLPEADPTKIKQALTEYELVPEEWGGSTIFAEVSAKNNTGVKELLELILLQAEMLEFKANPNKEAIGVVIESKLDKGRGPVCTVLVRNGTLKVGAPFVTGIHFGKVRAMISDWGDKITEAGPSMPVEIQGLPGVPDAGDSFIVVKDDVTAKQISEIRLAKNKETELAKSSKVSLEELYDKIKSGDVKELNIIIKGDVHGSVEAAIDSLEKMGTEAVKVNIIHSGVGGVAEGDVMLASASNAVVIGFNVRAEAKAQELAEKEGVDIRFYSIIYDLTDEIKKAMEGLLEPTLVEEALGLVEVREVFTVPKIGAIAGSYVSKGKVVRGSMVRLLRDSVVIYEGKLSSLRRFKDDVKEVASGYECGVGIENYNDIKVGDVIEVYTVKEVATKLQ